jgi:hypothetical protein
MIKIIRIYAIFASFLGFLGCAEQSSPVGRDVPNSVFRLTTLDDEDNERSCTATFLGGRAFLTAGHCFDEFVFSAHILVGKKSLPVIDAKVHPDYHLENDRSLFDVSVFFVHEDSSLLDLQPVSFKSASATPADSYTFFGFGRTNPDDPMSGGVLKTGPIKIEGEDQNFFYSHPSDANILTCYGDSGGPLVDECGQGCNVIAILSAGTEELTCSKKERSTYVKISNPFVLNFIETAIKSSLNNTSK